MVVFFRVLLVLLWFWCFDLGGCCLGYLLLVWVCCDDDCVVFVLAADVVVGCYRFLLLVCSGLRL